MTTTKAHLDSYLVLLTQYLAKFDDQTWTDKECKDWLDETWIPAVRASVAEAKGEA